MMDASDAHLEKALEEYNEKVNLLEGDGPSPELLDAYVNRARILQMMEYRTSALEDLGSAATMIGDADAGTYVKVLTAMGEIVFDQGGDPIEEYSAAASRLDEVKEGSRYFDYRGLVRMCIQSCMNLIDSEQSDAAVPFLEKGYATVANKSDTWSANRLFQLHGLAAEIAHDAGDMQEAVENYSKAVDCAVDLMSSGHLEDMEELVTVYVSKAECEAGLGLTQLRKSDLQSAIVLLDGMGITDDDILDLMASLHHQLAQILMDEGNTSEAEAHMLKVVEIGARASQELERM